MFYILIIISSILTIQINCALQNLCEYCTEEDLYNYNTYDYGNNCDAENFVDFKGRY